MFRKIIDYFTGMKRLLEQNNELARLARREGEANRKSDEKFRELVNCHLISMQKDIEELRKRMSWIENKMSLMRRGCMDNDFPGKEDL
jgi:hypothetical protein